MNPFKLERLGLIMEPKAGEANEVEGVLNPAAVRGRDGQLYLFPRLVGKGNYSRIGIARVRFDKSGDPTGVERLGVVLEPEADYELMGDGRGGCEDPRITYVEPLGRWDMTYTALSEHGPRIAIARSEDLFNWERMGLARFHPYKDVSFDGIDDKDAGIFPSFVPDPTGKRSFGLLHRPLFPGSRPEEKVEPTAPEPASPAHESIWISYWHADAHRRSPNDGQFVAHHQLARPQAAWEELKIGGGTPPVLCRHGWLIVYHGVHEEPDSTPERRRLCYSAGVMILSRDRPHRVLYRSPEPVLAPESELELHGAVEHVVFPTGIDRRDDLGAPDRFDIYYGMADDRIGAARLVVPEHLPESLMKAGEIARSRNHARGSRP
jgi:predicted GH43/DUF377 family glycosyl hydrolase